MRIYVKADTSALTRAHDKLVELDKAHQITFIYSNKYGHYGVVELFGDVLNTLGVLTSCGVEQLPKSSN